MPTPANNTCFLWNLRILCQAFTAKGLSSQVQASGVHLRVLIGVPVLKVAGGGLQASCGHLIIPATLVSLELKP